MQYQMSGASAPSVVPQPAGPIVAPRIVPPAPKRPRRTGLWVILLVVLIGAGVWWARQAVSKKSAAQAGPAVIRNGDRSHRHPGAYDPCERDNRGGAICFPDHSSASRLARGAWARRFDNPNRQHCSSARNSVKRKIQRPRKRQLVRHIVSRRGWHLDFFDRRQLQQRWLPGVSIRYLARFA